MKTYNKEDLEGFYIEQQGAYCLPSGNYEPLGEVEKPCVVIGESHFMGGTSFIAGGCFNCKCTFDEGCAFLNCIFLSHCEFGVDGRFYACQFKGTAMFQGQSHLEECEFNKRCDFDGYSYFKKCAFVKGCEPREEQHSIEDCLMLEENDDQKLLRKVSEIEKVFYTDPTQDSKPHELQKYTNKDIDSFYDKKNGAYVLPTGRYSGGRGFDKVCYIKRHSAFGIQVGFPFGVYVENSCYFPANSVITHAIVKEECQFEDYCAFHCVTFDGHMTFGKKSFFKECTFTSQCDFNLLNEFEECTFKNGASPNEDANKISKDCTFEMNL